MVVFLLLFVFLLNNAQINTLLCMSLCSSAFISVDYIPMGGVGVSR